MARRQNTRKYVERELYVRDVKSHDEHGFMADRDARGALDGDEHRQQRERHSSHRTANRKNGKQRANAKSAQMASLPTQSKREETFVDAKRGIVGRRRKRELVNKTKQNI